MSVYLRSGSYNYRFEYEGKEIRRSTHQSNYKVALQMEAKHKTACAMGEAGLSGQRTACPTLRRFVVERIRPWSEKQKATTTRWFRDGANPLLTYAPLADLRLSEITSESIADYAAAREALGLAVGSINRELRVLRRSLRLAQEWGLLKQVPKVKMHGAEVRRERVVTESEFRKYLASASPLLADVAIVLNETGLRPDECHRLEWPDIDFHHNCLRVRKGKTAAARRRLPLTANVRSVLETRWQYQGEPGTGFVFPSGTKTGHIDHSTTKKMHHHAIKSSGVRTFCLYSLRHTFATTIASHVDAWTLCKVMGWASLSVAMTYVHPDDQKVLQAFSRHINRHMGDSRLLEGVTQ